MYTKSIICKKYDILRNSANRLTLRGNIINFKKERRNDFKWEDLFQTFGVHRVGNSSFIQLSLQIFGITTRNIW